MDLGISNYVNVDEFLAGMFPGHRRNGLGTRL